MADMEEQDRRHFALAVKTDDPMKTYSDIKAAIEEAMSPEAQAGIEDEPQAIADWLRRT